MQNIVLKSCTRAKEVVNFKKWWSMILRVFSWDDTKFQSQHIIKQDTKLPSLQAGEKQCLLSKSWISKGNYNIDFTLNWYFYVYFVCKYQYTLIYLYTYVKFQ